MHGGLVLAMHGGGLVHGGTRPQAPKVSTYAAEK